MNGFSGPLWLDFDNTRMAEGGGNMRSGNKDPIFWVVITILCLVHVDFWGWDKIHPLLFGWIPYHLWFDGILTLVGSVFFLWWGVKGWPEPPADWKK